MYPSSNQPPWELGFNDLPGNFGQGGAPVMSSLLPSSLKDCWGDDDPLSPIPSLPSGIARQRPPGHRAGPLPTPESAPPTSFLPQEDMTFMGEIEPEGIISPGQYFTVQFHPNRSVVFRANPQLQLHAGDYVLTEADRGYDVGRVVQAVAKPSQREVKNAKQIIRKAAHLEVMQLPQKAEREQKALQLCQMKVRELGLPMVVTGAEFQFDGKKLIFYYSASSYVDFRNLVRSLFKIYGTRIWMVWHDGQSPVQDVFAQPNHPQQFQ